MVTYTITPDEEIYQIMSKIYRKDNPGFRKRRNKLILGCILSLVVIAMSVAGIVLSRHKDMQWLAFLAVGAGMFLGGFYQLVFGMKRQVLRAIRQAGKFTEGLERTYTFGEDIYIHSEKTDSRISWDMVETWGEWDHYLYLHTGNGLILLDENRLQEAELEEIKSRLA